MSDDSAEPIHSPDAPTATPATPVQEAAAARAAAEAVGPTEVVLAPPAARRAPWRRFAFLAIPAIAILELLAHEVQIHRVVSDAEWLAARDAVRKLVQPKDLVVMAPYWTDPIGRELFKDEILSVAREARPDATRFPRAIEVSIRGQHLDELAGWKIEREESVGPVRLTVYDNPSYTPVKDDLVDHVAEGRMAVTSAGGDCPFQHVRAETGPLGFGPAIPADRFTCPGGGLIGATVLQPTDYRPHRCLFAPPQAGGKTLHVRFLDVTFGDVLHGHAALDWDSAARLGDPPVTLVWKVGDRTIGRIVAGNKDGWKAFEIDTRDLKGTKGELVAEVSAPSAKNRLYCFEADTR